MLLMGKRLIFNFGTSFALKEAINDHKVKP